jgi:BirA family transcriptional regulator, biotin operon repressor / biotin---[acetyl-CoA-carboxylase] ligase
MERNQIAPWTVRSQLSECSGFYRLIILDRTASTSDVARDAATRGLPEGVVVIADEQTSGRGQRGRRWLAPAGENLLLSVLLRPQVAPADTFLLSALTASAVATAIKSTTGLRPMLKWPNDVLASNRKVAGILVETSISDLVDIAVVGIGLNANWYPTDLEPGAAPATSLRDQVGHQVSRARLASTVLSELFRRYRALIAGDRQSLWLEWRDQLVEPGRRITVHDETGRWNGEARGVMPTGELIVVDDAGSRRFLSFGQATIRLEDHEG